MMYRYWPVVQMDTEEVYTVLASNAESAVLEVVYTEGIGDKASREVPVVWSENAVYCGYFVAIHDEGVR